MKRRTGHGIAVCLLGLLLGLGMGLSAVQASDMAVKMALSGDMDAPGGGDCAGCGGDDGVASGNCVSACIYPIVMLPAPASCAPIAASNAAFADDTEPLLGRASAPDPHPPKPVVLL